MRLFVLFFTFLASAFAFTPASPSRNQQTGPSVAKGLTSRIVLAAEEWKGEVVQGGDGKIRGCTLQQLEGSLTEWTITIDGVEADLGRFSEVVYKKLLQDAKQQRFQGFRPGTIPPHLEPTYRAFAMDGETVLEAMQQNSIRPFENCRSEMYLYDFCIPPALTKKKKSSKKRKTNADPIVVEAMEDEPASWRTFETMKEAIDAGWKPGQSFSFLAKDVKGQKVKNETKTAGATPLGVNF
jgi:hypothetical protein